VHICHTAHELLENVLAGVLGQPLVRLLFDVMENGAALAHLHDQVHLSALVDHLMQFHNVWVPQI